MLELEENKRFLIPRVPINFTASGMLWHGLCKENVAEFTNFSKSAESATSELIKEAISESFASLLLSIELIWAMFSGNWGKVSIIWTICCERSFKFSDNCKLFGKIIRFIVSPFSHKIWKLSIVFVKFLTYFSFLSKNALPERKKGVLNCNFQPSSSSESSAKASASVRWCASLSLGTISPALVRAILVSIGPTNS